MLSRSSSLRVGLALTLAAPRAATAQTPDVPVLRVGALVSDSASEIFYAEELGMFKAAGISVEISEFTSSGAISAGVVSGALDIGSSGSGVVAAAHQRGVPLYLIAPAGIYGTATPTTLLVVLPNSPLRSAKDLAGKTIAVSTLRDTPQVAVLAWIDRNGGRSDASSYIEMHTPEMLPALQSGRIDAMFIAEPYLTQARGSVRALGKAYDAIAPRFMIIGWVAMQGWLEKNPVLAAKFVAVMRQAGAWANANHAAASKILARKLKLSEELAQTMNHNSYAPALDPALIQPLIDRAAEYHTLARSFPATELFYPGLR